MIPKCYKLYLSSLKTCAKKKFDEDYVILNINKTNA